MTDKQPEALRLADELETATAFVSSDGVVRLEMGSNMAEQAAAELRRLHDLNTDKTEIIAALSARITALETANAELLELLIEARDELKVEPEMWEFVARIRAAIAKHGETK